MYSVYEPAINHHNLFFKCKPFAVFTLEMDYPSLQNPSKLMDKQIDEVRWINSSIFTSVKKNPSDANYQTDNLSERASPSLVCKQPFCTKIIKQPTGVLM